MDNGEPQPAVARRWHVLGFVLLTGAGLYAVVVSLKLGLWRQNSPGEGLFPFITALAMTVFGVTSLAGLLRASAATAAPAAGDARGSAYLRVGLYLAGLVFYAGLLDALGFIVSTVLAVIFILRFAERYGWGMSALIAIGTAATCQLLFVRWLGAILPTGFVWDKVLF